jgi:hypothetical protein
MRSRLVGLGLFNEKGNECFYKCVTFPLTDREGRVVGLYGRGIDSKRHLYLAGPRRGVFGREKREKREKIPVGENGNGDRDHGPLVLAESVLDAVAWLEMGATSATSIYGVHGLTGEIEAYLVEVEPSCVILAMDADNPGEEAAGRLVARLRDLAVPEIRRVRYPDGVKDGAELLERLGAGAGREVLAVAVVVGGDGVAGGGVAASMAEEFEAGKDTVPRIRLAGSELEYRLGDLVWRISGVGPRRARTQTVFLRRGPDRQAADEFRIFAEKDRRRFVESAGEKLAVQAARLESDLGRILAWLSARVEAPDSPKNHGKRPVLPGEMDAAMALLGAPDLLDRIAADVEAVGYVGDRRAKLLVYLVALSRRLEKPLSGIVKSTTGSGKTALLDAVVELVPPEEVFPLSRLTPGALWRFGREDLVHKLLVVDEAEGLDDALYALRTFLERKKLVLASPQKDPLSGELVTKILEVLGPASVLYATTRPRMNREDENRALLVTLVEEPEQTRRIQDFHKGLYTKEGYERRDRAEKTKRLHQDAQRILEPVRVLIPFQERMRFPDARPETTRDARRVLSLVEVLAYLHQYQRKRERAADGYTYVEASVADYRTAYELAAPVVYASLDDLAPQERRLYDSIEEVVKREAAKSGVEVGDYTFTRREIREKTELSQDHLKRYLRRLVELELLVVTGRHGTTGHVYRLMPEEGARALGHLTTPEELEAALGPKSEKK